MLNATPEKSDQTKRQTDRPVYNCLQCDSKRQLVVDGAPVTFLDIHLECDKMMTRWCNCTGAPPDKNTPDRTRDDDVIVPLLPKKKKT